MVSLKQSGYIAAVLLLAVAFSVVYASVSGLSMTTKTDLPNPVEPGKTYTVEVEVSNQNNYSVLLKWLNTTSSSSSWVQLPNESELKSGEKKSFSVKLKINSDFEGQTYRILKAEVFNVSSNKSLGTIQNGKGFFLNYTKEHKEKEFCEYGDNGTLEIRSFDITNYGEGEDDVWQPLDNVEIEVKIKNTDRDNRVYDVLVDVAVYNKDGEDVTDDFDFEDTEIDLGRLDDRETKTAVFKIKELPADLEEGDYKLYFKAYSEDKEGEQCVSTSSKFSKKYYHEIEVKKEEDRAVVVKPSSLPKELNVVCGQNVEVSFDVYNIGDDKEKRVLVNLYNEELKIDEYDVLSDLKVGKKKSVSFSFKLPETMEKKNYPLYIVTYFDYDSDKDEMDPDAYDLNSDEDLDKTYKIKLNVLECKVPEPTINANLEKGEKTGEQFLIKAQIVNNAGTEQTYKLSLSGLSDWATGVEVDPSEVTLKPGESKDFVIAFTPSKEGFNTFRIQAVTNSSVFTKEIGVSVLSETKESSWKDVLTSRKVLVTLVVGIVALLILIFLVAIIRFTRRSSTRY